MNHIVKRIGILTGVFAAALCVFFLANNRWNSGQDQAVYMDMEAASLPSITVQMLGRDMNRLYGYRQEMNTTAAGENLTILPEDRALTVDITGGGVTGISYEVRSMDRARLVERTEVSDWQQTQQGIAATLPIQNLLTKEREYQLIIQLDTENYGSVYYYTRILWTDSAQHARDMVDLAADFSIKTFDYEQAKSLTTYLETSPSEDNSTFGHTSIHSSFSQLTWGKMNMQPEGNVEIHLKELDGVMCGVQLSYQAKRQGDGEEIQTVVQAAVDALAPDFPQAPKMLLPMYIALLEQSGMPDRREQPACAAALEYLFHRLSGRKVDLRRIAAKNGVSPRFCRMMAKRILRAVKNMAKNKTKGSAEHEVHQL